MDFKIKSKINDEEKTIIDSDNCEITLNMGFNQSEIERMIEFFLFNLTKTDYIYRYMTTNNLINLFCNYFISAPEVLSLTMHSKEIDGEIPFFHNDFRYLTGDAECLESYSGSSTTRGTYNTNESKIEELPNGHKLHLVYDFPTHAGNGMVNRVSFFPTYFYKDDNYSKASNFLPTAINEIGLIPVLNDYLFEIKVSRWRFGERNTAGRKTITAGANGEIMVKLGDELSAFYYDPKIGEVINIEYPNFKYRMISYFDDKFWYGYTGLNNNEPYSSKDIVMYDLIINENGNVEQGSEEKILKDVNELTGYKCNRLGKVIETPKYYYVYMSVSDTSGFSSSQKNVILIYDKRWEFVKTIPLMRNDDFATFSLMGLNHAYDNITNDLFLQFIDEYNESEYWVIDGDLTSTYCGRSINNTSFFANTPDGSSLVCAKYGEFPYSSAYVEDEIKTFGGFMVFGHGKFKKPIIDIKLDEPLRKTNAETLKLIFDFEITIE